MQKVPVSSSLSSSLLPAIPSCLRPQYTPFPSQLQSPCDTSWDRTTYPPHAMGFFSRSKKSEKGSTNKAQLLRPSPALPPPLPAPPPAGLLPPPPSWDGSANGQSAPTTVSYQQPPPPYGPVVVNQHYYFSPPPQLPFSQYPQNKNGSLARLNLCLLYTSPSPRDS